MQSMATLAFSERTLMVSRSLMRELAALDATSNASIEESIESEVANIFGDQSDWLPSESQTVNDNKIVTGRVRKVTTDMVFVDVGYKSEGVIELREWFNDDTRQIVPPAVGDVLDVLVEAIEDADGMVTLSFRKAQRQKAWDTVVTTKREGDVVSGPVVRKIKGGLLVNIGVPVFLPASQIDVRRPANIDDFIGRTIECKIVSIDVERRNMVVSRRRLIEGQRVELKAKILGELEVGQIRSGIVRNIATFGAFVDIGGIDGLLHVTDMAWRRVERPEEIVHVNQTIDVCILKIDKEKEKISLGLKQTTPCPWTAAAAKYPVGSRHVAKVANLMNYGAFVCLEDGVEGLVHISEMSWGRRVNHPNELLTAGDSVNVEVLALDLDKKEISLGIKQTLENPWSAAAAKYPVGTRVRATVRNLTTYGAFAEIEEGIDGLIHVNDLSWVRKITHPREVVNVGDQIDCVVLQVETDRRRIALGVKQTADDPWSSDIPSRYQPGETKSGSVTKITNFGLFIEMEPGLEGLLHISELPEELKKSVKVGDTLEVRVLRVESEERKLALGIASAATTTSETETPLADGQSHRDEKGRAASSRGPLRGGVERGQMLDPELFSLNS